MMMMMVVVVVDVMMKIRMMMMVDVCFGTDVMTRTRLELLRIEGY